MSEEKEKRRTVGAEAHYEEESRRIEPGDRLLLFTDGLTEARAGDDMFGEARLRALLGSRVELEVEELRDEILGEVRKWVGDRRPLALDDDLTLVVLGVQ